MKFQPLILTTIFGITLLSISACTTNTLEIPKPDYKISLGTDDIFFAEEELNRTAVAFIGDSTLISNVITDISDIVDNNSSDNGSASAGGSDLKFRPKALYQLSADASWRLPISERIAWLNNAGASIGKTEVYFPDGIDILVEPITLYLNNIAVDINSGIEAKIFALNNNKINGFLQGGVGYRAAKTRLSIQSPLLNVKHKSTIHDDYVYLGFTVDYLNENLPDIKSFFETQVKRYKDQRYLLVLKLGVSF